MAKSKRKTNRSTGKHDESKHPRDSRGRFTSKAGRAAERKKLASHQAKQRKQLAGRQAKEQRENPGADLSNKHYRERQQLDQQQAIALGKLKRRHQNQIDKERAFAQQQEQEQRTQRQQEQSKPKQDTPEKPKKPKLTEAERAERTRQKEQRAKEREQRKRQTEQRRAERERQKIEWEQAKVRREQEKARAEARRKRQEVINQVGSAAWEISKIIVTGGFGILQAMVTMKSVSIKTIPLSRFRKPVKPQRVVRRRSSDIKALSIAIEQQTKALEALTRGDTDDLERLMTEVKALTYGKSEPVPDVMWTDISDIEDESDSRI